MANTTNRTTRIKHVYGNVLKLAIPLTLRTVTLEGGIVEVTDTDYTPSNHYPVVVQFVNGPLKYELDATIRDNYIAVVEDKGTIPVGNYAIVVLCKDDNGDPRRFKQRCVLEVVDVTADAGIEVGIEFEAQEWLLDGAIFLAIKGEDGIDGVGIESITTDETSVSGEYNQVTFHLTNGSSYTLNVRNGESTEQTLPANVVIDENYVHTDNNYTDTDKQKVESVDKLFADAEYDRISRRLNFFKHGDTMHTNPLKSIDITDFVRDSRVSSFRIIDGNLTIKLNSDGNNEEFKVPISRIVNLADYYTKAQVDAKVDGKADTTEVLTKTQHLGADGKLKSEYATQLVLYYMGEPYDEGITTPVQPFQPIFDNGYISYAISGSTAHSLGQPQPHILYCNAKTNKLYRWNGSEFVQVGGSGSGSGGYEPPVGGIPKTDLASGVQASLDKADTALQSSDLEGYATTDDVDNAVAALVSSAPQTLDTLNELAEALGDDPNFATTMATQLGNKVDKETGKGLSTNDYTTAEKTKLAGIAAGAEVNVQPNWTQTNTSADDYIKNKPTLATVATSGSYNDLQDKPTIPAAYDDTTLSDRVSALENAGFITTETDPTVPNWAKQSSKPTYTAQEVGALPASTTIPSKVSDLTNDSGFTSNAGTITGITMNGASKGTSGVVDLGTVITAHQDISGKANASDVYTTTQADTLLAGKLSKSDVSVETQGDGTVDINVKDDTYTINLNHTHEGMAKIVKCTEATLPQMLADDTIYVQVDDAEAPTEIQSLWIAGLEFVGGGGGVGTPRLTSPSETTIDFNGSSTTTITVKGNSYVTGAINLSVTGDFTITDSNQQIVSSISASDATTGVQLTLTKGSNFTTGTLTISSATSEFASKSFDVRDSQDVVVLSGVKLTGTQWLQTDYKPNANTEIKMTVTFERNPSPSIGVVGDSSTGNKFFLSCQQSGTDRLEIYAWENITNGFQIMCICPSTPVKVITLSSLLTPNSLFEVRGGRYSFTPNGGTNVHQSMGQIATMNTYLEIGRFVDTENVEKIFNWFYLTIHDITIKEGNTTVRHYVPKKISGVPGLYDSETDTFITSMVQGEPLVAVTSNS